MYDTVISLFGASFVAYLLLLYLGMQCLFYISTPSLLASSSICIVFTLIADGVDKLITS